MSKRQFGYRLWQGAARLVIVALALTILLLGIVIFPMPIPFGAVLILIGIGMLVAASDTAAEIVKYFRKRHVRINNFLSGVEGRLPGALSRILKRTIP